MTRASDLESVKAMLLDALRSTKTHGVGDAFLLSEKNFGDPAKSDGHEFELWFDGNCSFDADKLAATVLEWSEARKRGDS